jgi:hypothetical protein
MKKRIILLPLIFLFSPAPEGLAINPRTKACGTYWAGDEFIYYQLPDEWKIYYPINGYIETEFGTCKLGDEYDKRFETCCNDLGFYYSSGNIGKLYGKKIITEYSKTFMFGIDATSTYHAIEEKLENQKLPSIIIPMILITAIVIIFSVLIVDILREKQIKEEKPKGPEN